MNIYTVTGIHMAQFTGTFPMIGGVSVNTIPKKFKFRISADNEVHAYYKVIEKYNVYNTCNYFYIIYDVKVDIHYTPYSKNNLINILI